ncbi:TPA: Asp-tRNA(Asn)/Glu-tRNA(Gln) amidotransferase subunit GatA, partial [archaeon]|nr:Asp-tRNA(Asn)/Glu-tRNA(Gln) amidotransferase subunit GatA [Candidatus Naiadarchaeales archaeon SRR2090153.bin461]
MKTVDLAKAVEEAKKLDQKYNFFTTIASASGSGIPIVAKDNICTKDIETTAGSEILKGYKPTFDATVISRLKAAGGKVIGKNTMDEFGFGTFATNTYKIPKNPLDEERSCGGSSGGSAGYVAASKLVDFAVS